MLLEHIELCSINTVSLGSFAPAQEFRGRDFES
jgi:hypothetical protein